MKYLNITSPDIENGIGCRVTLWIPGCGHNCPGCHNAWTANYNQGNEFTQDTFKELCDILSGNEESGFSYVAGSLNFDLMKFAKHFNSALNGRGGGRGTMIQGKVTATKQDILDYFNSLELNEI